MIIDNTIKHKPFVWIDFEFNDFNDFDKVVQSWNVDFLQLNTATFYSRFQQIIFPEVQIGHVHFNCPLDQKGTSPQGMWTFVVMGEDASMYKFNHDITLSTSTMIIYAPGDLVNAVSYDGFHVYTFSVQEIHMGKLMRELGLDEIKEKLSKIDRVELEYEQAASLREQLKDILHDAASREQKSISEEANNLLINFLPTKFLKEMGKQVGCAKHKVIKEKHFLYLEARAYMHTNLYRDITIEGIAKKFKLSERTLRNYFKNELNTSPKQYLIALRLNRIRDELKVSKNSKGVVERTARKFGFYHMGQFAKSYKKFFGELPSQTLKNTNGKKTL